jgi:hypothetical protein
MRTASVLTGLAVAGLLTLTACGGSHTTAAAPPSVPAVQTTTPAAPSTAATTTSPATTTPAASPSTSSPPTSSRGGSSRSTSSQTTSAQVAPRPTKRVVLAPVTRHGTAAAGYRVVAENIALDCPPQKSAGSGVFGCTPNAAAADACWTAATAAHVLCLRDPWANVLTEMSVGRTFPAPQTADSRPLGLLLDDGDHCRLRNGGAWGQQQERPDLFALYVCTKHAAIWGATTGIDKSSPTWTVRVGNINGRLLSRNVVKAYYVTAAG